MTGIGADTFYGNGGNSANNGNNIFTNPHAGDAYYATGGAGVGAIAASAVNTGLTVNGNFYAFSSSAMDEQLNTVDYSAIASLGSTPINLSGTTADGVLPEQDRAGSRKGRLSDSHRGIAPAFVEICLAGLTG